MTIEQDHPRSPQRRALAAAVLSTVLGLAAISGGIASGTTPSTRANVTTLGAVRAAPVTFASTTTTATTVPADTTTAVVPASTTAAASTTPAARRAVAPTEDAGAAALRYIAATQPQAAPEPAPAADPAPARSGGSVEDAIAASFGDVYNKAVRVARCESSLNPNAVSAGGGNYGLFQINKVHQDMVESMGYSWDQIFDPYVNAAVARHIYDNAGGWGPWGCRGA